MIETTPEVISPAISLLYPKAENKIQPKDKESREHVCLWTWQWSRAFLLCLEEEFALAVCSAKSTLFFLLSVLFYWHMLILDLYFISLKQKLRPLYHSFHNYDFHGAQTVKRLSTMQETRVRSLGQEDPLEKEMEIHSRKIPRTEEPGRLQSMGSQRVGHDWATSLSLSDFVS